MTNALGRIPKCIVFLLSEAKMKSNIKLLLFSLSLTSSLVYAGLHSGATQRACPDGWADTSMIIPVAEPSGDPWGPTNGAQDKAIAKTHLSSVRPIETIDTNPVTDDDLVNDLLTVASECLVYRNFEVDAARQAPPAPQAIDSTVAWVPVVVM